MVECYCGIGAVPHLVLRSTHTVDRGSGGPGLTQAPTGTALAAEILYRFQLVGPVGPPDRFSPDCFQKITHLVYESPSNGVGPSGSQARFPCLSCGAQTLGTRAAGVAIEAIS